MGDGVREVGEEGGASVEGWVGVEPDVVDVGAWVGGFGEGADGVEAVGGVAGWVVSWGVVVGCGEWE